ncbi:MAG: UDP-N-acetylmuramate--L-alanine ligase [Butyrivibrio sp.]|nr:UDP-N-acetylmuramate--L-alanine ligase [Butyrivibrio sp.]
MYHIDFNRPIRVHFIGIGGISMSGLAEILLERGFEISGSDIKQSALTERLSEKGVRVCIGQTAENIRNGIDLIVYTAAISKDNPEFVAAEKSAVPMLTRAELLGEIMANYRVAIGVSGTHGKTTTTSMLAEIMIAAELDPTVTVGGMLPSINGNLRIGSSANFITEACEYTNSFLSFLPTVGVILNVQEDHLDFFKDIDDIRNSFRLYANLLPENGLLVINGDINDYEYISGGVKCPVITVGKSEFCDYRADGICYDETGCCSYTPICRGLSGERVRLGVPGIHNVYNSLAALAAADWLGCERSVSVSALGNFGGTERRFQKKGVVRGFTVIDDYAHHPTEINATLDSALNYPHRRIVCVFQPHTYTRTSAFLKDFASALSRADTVILADIYAARERNTIGISSADLKAEIDKLGGECIYEPDFEKIQKKVAEICGEGDLVITMGAGNIVEVGEALLKNY